MRPSKYSEELAESICTDIATSTNGLEQIAENNGVNARSVYRWLLKEEGFSQKYARARSEQTQLLADQLIVLADTDRICSKVTTKADGSVETVVLDQVERSKLQIDTRKWLLSKLDPKKYGDKTQLANNDGDGPAEIIIRRVGG